VAILLSIAAALTYGAADFVGGLMSKRNEVLRVVFVSQLLGNIPLFLAFPLVNDGAMSTEALLWGAGAGIAGGTGVVLLYRGLAMGRMSVVAPITAVEAAAFPVLFGLATGERPSETALIGVGVAIVAVALISRAPENSSEEVDPTARSGVAEALGAGFAFGAFFILLDGAGDEPGMWPLLAVRATSFVLLGAAVVATRVPLKPAAGTFIGIAVAGVLDVAANVFYLLSTRHGLLSLVAVITSMYPAMTVLLARLWLKERMVRVQIVGLGFAAMGITLIATG
jgi:drug/metabolite transporter (DMT)-like permease